MHNIDNTSNITTEGKILKILVGEGLNQFKAINKIFVRLLD